MLEILPTVPLILKVLHDLEYTIIPRFPRLRVLRVMQDF